MSERRVRKALYANVNVSKRGKHGVCVCVRVCVCEKERKRERERMRKLSRLTGCPLFVHFMRIMSILTNV